MIHFTISTISVEVSRKLWECIKVKLVCFTEISLFPMQPAHFSIIFACPSLVFTTSQGLSISLYHQSVLRLKKKNPKNRMPSDKSMLRSTMLIRVLSVLAFKVASKDLNNILWYPEVQSIAIRITLVISIWSENTFPNISSVLWVRFTSILDTKNQMFNLNT